MREILPGRLFLLPLCLLGCRVEPDPPVESDWTERAAIAGGPRQENGVVALDGKIFVIGGFDENLQVVPDVEAYDPVRDTWESLAPLPVPLHHPNVAAVDGKIYVLGSLRGLGFDANGQVFEYDPLLNTWTEKTPMPPGTERGGSAVGVLGTSIFIAGGFRNGSVSDASVYDAATDTWEILPNLPLASDHLVGGVIDGLFYAVGGRNGGQLHGDLNVFDPALGEWSPREPMPTPRGGCMGAVLGGRLFVFGGEGNAQNALGVFDDNEGYNPATDTWTAFEPMRSPRHGTGAAALGDTIFVPGGATRDNFGAVDIHESFTP